MKCYKCNKLFYRKRGFLTLFDTTRYYMCDACYNKRPIKIKYELIDVGEYKVNIVSLLEGEFKENIDCYILELNQIYSFFFGKYFDYHIIILDYLSLNLTNLELIEFLCECFDKPLLFICGVVRK